MNIYTYIFNHSGVLANSLEWGYHSETDVCKKTKPKKNDLTLSHSLVEDKRRGINSSPHPAPQ